MIFLLKLKLIIYFQAEKQFNSYSIFIIIQKQIMEQNKNHLIIELYGLTLKRYSVFFKKFVLYDQQRLYTKHNKHYDYQCEGIQALSNYLQRKTTKLKQQAFYNIKFSQSQQTQQVLQMEPKEEIKYKNITRMNTSIQESDGSFLYSPNTKRKNNRVKTQFQHSTLTDLTSTKSQGLLQLFYKVKKINTQAYQQSLNPAKSSYFNLTLGGRPSIQTFHQCSCNCHGFQSSSKKQGKYKKRQRILQKFQDLQEKIYLQSCYAHVGQGAHSYTSRNCKQKYYSKSPLILNQKSRVAYLTTDDENGVTDRLVSSKSVAFIHQRQYGNYYQ